MSSFTLRTTIGISRVSGTAWFSVQDQTELIIATGVQNASVFVVIQNSDAAGNETFHEIRYGNKYIGNEIVDGVVRLKLVNKPYPWYFVSSNTAPITNSTVDLLVNTPFFMSTLLSQAVFYTTFGIPTGLISLIQLNNVNEKLILDIEAQSQPNIDESRILGAGTYSPAPAYSTILSTTGAVTINGFTAGIDGQSMVVYGTGGSVITANSSSILVQSNQQIITPSGGPTLTPPNGSFEFIYSGATQKWRLLTQMAGTSGTTVSLADGTAAAPSLSFSADPDTGLYRQIADSGVIRITNDGTETLRFTTTGLIPLATGTLDLGTGALAYQNVYTNNIGTSAGPLVMQGTVFNPTGDLSNDIGTAVIRWGTVFTPAINSGAADITLVPNAAVVPSADNTKSLGLPGTRWSEVDTLAINSGAGNLTLTPNAAVIPSADNTKSLGLPGTRWSEVDTLAINSGAANLILTPTTAVIPSADNTKTLGESATRWSTVFAPIINSGPATDLTLSAGSNFIKPPNDIATNLGTGAARFASILTTNVNSGTSDLSLTPNAAVVPNADNTKSLGISGTRWSNLYATNWFPENLSTNAFLENGTLTPDLQTTNTDITITYSAVRSATWYRQGNMVFVTGQLQWNTLTAGTGDGILLNSTPTAFPPALSTGTPGTITYSGISIVSGTISILATTTVGRSNILNTTDAGVLAAIPIGSFSGVGQILYHFTYYTTTLA
jgi:hypothetical protein